MFISACAAERVREAANEMLPRKCESDPRHASSARYAAKVTKLHLSEVHRSHDRAEVERQDADPLVSSDLDGFA